MDAVLAFSNDVLNLAKPELSCIAGFKRAARSKSYVVNGKDYGVEQRRIQVVEWAIDKDIFVKLWGRFGHERLEPKPK